MNVTLTWQEVASGALVGAQRRISSKRKNLTDRLIHGSAWDVDIEGACGELAACKALRVYWNPSVDVFNVPDIPPDIDVKATASGQFIVKPHYIDSRRYLFVQGTAPTYKVVGWIFGYEAKHAEWFTTQRADYPKVYFVPREALHSPDSVFDPVELLTHA